MTWNEYGCDDFKADKVTVCHVPAENYAKYIDNFGSSVNVKFKKNAMGKCGNSAYWCFDSETGELTISGTGDMYDYEYETQPWIDYPSNITFAKIERGITSIGAYAFCECVNLKSVDIQI